MSAKTLSSQPLSHLLWTAVLCGVLGCPVFLRPACGQATQNAPNELEIALTEVRSKSIEVSARDVVVIADAKAVQAIPDLEEQFRRATNVDTKVSIASGLVKLRDTDNTYWNYLLQQATLAVDSNIPDSNFSESQGKLVLHSPELQKWADAQKISFNTAGIYARYDFPGKVLQLAIAGDPRGVPFLQRALHSRNCLIVLWAAKGLVLIQDKQSIPLIIEAARMAPTGYGVIIAESLIYFDDAQAQSAFDQYVPKDRAAMTREGKTKGMGVFGW